MLSKRIVAQSFYESLCPQCGYRTAFTASNIVQREFLNPCQSKKDYDVISYDIKCQVCLNKFTPHRHRTANFYNNPIKWYTLSPVQISYINQMKSFSAIVPTGVSGIRLGQRTEELKHNRTFDNLSVFIVDEISAVGEDVAVIVTGHNLTPDLLACQLGLEEVREMPIAQAMDCHFRILPQMLGDVSHVLRR